MVNMADGEFLKLKKALSNKFEFQSPDESILGAGSYGLVVKAKDLKDDQGYAIKSMRYTTGDKKALKYQDRELKLLFSMTLSEDSQRNVTKYVTSWIEQIDINEHRLCIQMELCSVNLRKFIYGNKICGPQIIEANPNAQPRFYQHVFRQILNGLVAIHDIGWVHRDIHPGNILIANPDPQHINDINVKIADFGLARHIGKNDIEIQLDMSLGGTIVPKLETLSDFGSKNKLFRAKELVTSQTYDCKVDVYSAGIVLYFISRYLEDKSKWKAEIQELKDGNLDINARVSHKDDEKLCNLIKNLLLTDPDKRLSAREAKEYMFPTQQANDSIDSGATTIEFFAKKEEEDDLSRCRMTEYTLSAMKKAVESRTGVPSDRQELKEELMFNDKTRRVKIVCDEDVKYTFSGAAEEKRKVEVVVMDVGCVRLGEDSNIEFEQVGSGLGQQLEGMSASGDSDL